jgi:DNA-binding NtrC family response regulator
MQTVFRRIAKIAPHHSTVLILGESGTGKEVVAREIHRRSPMADGPFIAVNCGGVPGELIESELFGHERGAFTGATQTRDGLFVAAVGGALFLDEVGAMPIPQQASLLRSLERKEIRRVGGTQTIEVNVRVIAATNTDLEQAMEAGLFRQDLYYRLSNMIINLPSLRERVEDIPLLGAHFLSIYAREHGRPPRRFSPQALDLLCNRHWPGNIRELQNVVEQAVLFSRDEMIKPVDLPFNAGGHEEKKPQTLRDVEREHIRAVLARTAGNKLKAARILGIPRPTLYHRMRKLGLETDPRPAGRARRDASN